MTNVTQLQIAESPAKESLLDLIEELKSGIEDGSIISLVAIPIHPSRNFSTRSAGDCGMLELGGLLGRAWMDAMDALKER